MRNVVLNFLGVLLCSTLCFACSNTDFEIFSSVDGVVLDYESGEAIEDASVVLSPTNKTVLTGTDGKFFFEDLDPGQYNITVQKSGYQPNRKLFTAVSGEETSLSIQLTKIPN